MDLAERIRGRDRRAIARGISLVEDGGPKGRELLAALFPYTGNAHIVGVTGAPGTGKSTLINALAKVYREQGRSLGIVAVDPSSPFSGGALLGDRIRMRDLSGDPDIYIRSMASRGSPGGLAWATSDVIRVLDAAGFRTIILETVGAGQAEVDIAHVAHTMLLLQVPGLGDDIQTIKAGLLEIADILVVNKADCQGAEQVVASLEAMLELAARDPQRSSSPAWRPPVVKTVATQGQGIAELVESIERHAVYLRESGLWQQREQARAALEVRRLVEAELMRRLEERLPAGRWEELMKEIADRKRDPYSVVAQLVALCLPD